MQNAGFEMVMVRQGFQTFTNPLKELTADFKAKRIIYNENLTLKWALLNTKIQTDVNDNWRPVKGRNRKKRIDPLVATLDAYVMLHSNYQEFLNFL